MVSVFVFNPSLDTALLETISRKALSCAFSKQCEALPGEGAAFTCAYSDYSLALIFSEGKRAVLIPSAYLIVHVAIMV